MSTKRFSFLLVAIIAATFTFIVVSCNDDENDQNNNNTPPPVTYTPVLDNLQITEVARFTAKFEALVKSDNGYAVTEKGFCLGTNPNPTINDTKFEVQTTTDKFSKKVDNLKPNTSYYVRAYAINEKGVGYSASKSFKTTDVSSTTVKDIDGNEYTTVEIGNQTWMTSNLKTTKLNDGTPIPNVTDNDTWTNLTTPAYSWYDNDKSTYEDPYGAYYNFFTVQTGKLCPAGWHVPTESEVKELRGSVDGITFKLMSKEYWNNSATTDDYGFSLVPSGLRANETFTNMYDFSYNWTSEVFYNKVAGINWTVNGNSGMMQIDNSYLEYGLPVRCVKD